MFSSNDKDSSTDGSHHEHGSSEYRLTKIYWYENIKNLANRLMFCS